MKPIANCPSCNAVIDAGESPELGSKVLCELCEHVWEIVLEDPIELAWPMDWIFNRRSKDHADLDERLEDLT